MKFRVTLAQVCPRLGDLDQNIELFLEKIKKAIREKAQLIVFPELGLTGYFLRDMVSEVALKSSSKALKTFIALSKKISICFGFVEETDTFEFFNSALYLEKGKVLHVHRKVYLPTYGMFDEQRYFSRGKYIRSFETQFGRAGILICEDLWHPTSLQIAVQDGAKFILALSSSPGRGVGAQDKLYSTQMWEEMNRFYASLYGIYLIYVNRGGVEEGINFWGGSEVVSPKGEILVKAPYFDEALSIVELDSGEIRRSRIMSPILRDENIDLVLYELSRIRDQYAQNQSKPGRGNARKIPQGRNSKNRV
ncbi:MAG: carbon-nitrogen hydrolase [Chlamydiae bacterium]|nr:carbon-nitrogen hydrolase [Chlamydiota bacterium]MBI3276478.1 carbon-nitrogen hydrolase [Chlamydiota bacterium]